tara:strand:+ start:864 stop:1334 length:471 start_codon:yes stop_codon:yes gene_type:complete
MNPTRLLTPADILNGNTKWLIVSEKIDAQPYPIQENDFIEEINGDGIDVCEEEVDDDDIDACDSEEEVNSEEDESDCEDSEEENNDSSGDTFRKRISVNGINRINKVLLNNVIRPSEKVGKSRFECLKNGIKKSTWNKERKLECYRQNRVFDDKSH